MSEVGTSLTTTGVIATLVSVLFAIAAYYVSRRRRTEPGGHIPVHTGPSTSRTLTPAASRAPKRPHVPLREAEESSAQGSNNSNKSALVIANPTITPGGVSTFNRLDPRDPEASPEDDERRERLYEWE